MEKPINPLTSLPFYGEDFKLEPEYSLRDILNGMAATGVVMAHAFQLGIETAWLHTQSTAFDEALEDHDEEICDALGFPLDEIELYELADWIVENQKLGWLVQVEKLFRPGDQSITSVQESRWFYAERLDLAMAEGIHWAKETGIEVSEGAAA